MEFQLTKPQKEIQKAAREFAKGEFDKELAQEMDKTGEFPIEIWQNAAELGFIGIHFPEELSGGGMGVLENTLIAEEFCKKDSTIGCGNHVFMLCCGVFVAFRQRSSATDIPAGCHRRPDAVGCGIFRC